MLRAVDRADAAARFFRRFGAAVSAGVALLSRPAHEVVRPLAPARDRARPSPRSPRARLDGSPRADHRPPPVVNRRRRRASATAAAASRASARSKTPSTACLAGAAAAIGASRARLERGRGSAAEGPRGRGREGIPIAGVRTAAPALELGLGGFQEAETRRQETRHARGVGGAPPGALKDRRASCRHRSRVCASARALRSRASRSRARARRRAAGAERGGVGGDEFLREREPRRRHASGLALARQQNRAEHLLQAGRCAKRGDERARGRGGVGERAR